MSRFGWAGLAFLSIVYLGLGAFVLIRAPFDSFPDERSHYNYMQELRLEHRLPPLSFDIKEIRIPEAFQPPLYYALGAIFLSVGGDFSHQVVLIRSLSLLLGWGTLLLIWKCARYVFPDRPDAWMLMTALAALNPQYIATHCGISNISATDFFSALTVWCLFRFLFEEKPALRESVLLGLFCGLALLSRTITLYLVPLCALVILLRWRKQPETPVFKAILLFSTAAFAVAGWWYIRNWIQYEDPFLWKIHQTTVGRNWARESAPDALFITQSFAFLHASFWAYFGRNEFHATVFDYALYLLLEVVAVWGAAEILLKRKDTGFEPPSFRKDAFLLALACALLALGEILLLQLRIKSPQGRYLFMAMPGIAVVLGAGLYKAFPYSLRRALSFSLAGMLLLQCVRLLWLYWRPHYL